MPTPNEILHDIKQVLEISSRVDERVKLIQSVQQELANKVNQVSGDISNLAGRVMVLESKNGGKIHLIEEEIDMMSKRIERMDFGGTEIMKSTSKIFTEDQKLLLEKVNGIDVRVQNLEHTNEGWQGKIKQYSGLVIQGIWVIIVCWILYRLGISTPPIP